MLLSLTLGIQNTIPLQAIAPQPLMIAQRKTIIYQCNQGRSFEAEYTATTARVTLDKQTLSLPQVPVASGVRYSDGRTTLSTKGDEAFIEVDNQITYRDCTAITPAAVTPARSGCTAILTANNANSRINVRSGAGLQNSIRHYGLVGDEVVILRGDVDGFAIQNDRRGDQWVQVEFLESKARGWIRRDLISFRC